MKDFFKALAIVVVLVFVGLCLLYINSINQHKALSCNNKTAIKLLKETIRDPKNYSEVSYWGINPNKPLDMNNIVEYRDPDVKIHKTYCEATIQDQDIYYNIYNQSSGVTISVFITKQ